MSARGYWGANTRNKAGHYASMNLMQKQVEAAPDSQVSLTDPDARSIATSGKGTRVVGYNAQMAVDAERHLIVAHEVANIGHERSQ